MADPAGSAAHKVIHTGRSAATMRPSRRVRYDVHSFPARTTVKETLCDLLLDAVNALNKRGELALNSQPEFSVERTRNRTHGDFASNIALQLAKTQQRKPRELAEMIVAALPASDQLEKVEIAGPGFINFFLHRRAWHAELGRVFSQGLEYGRSRVGAHKIVGVEF